MNDPTDAMARTPSDDNEPGPGKQEPEAPGAHDTVPVEVDPEVARAEAHRRQDDDGVEDD